MQVPRLARDLDIPIEIIAFPTVCEADGLALSSRNLRLSAEQRVAAPKLAEILFEAAERLAKGPPGEAVFAEAKRSLPPVTEKLNVANYGPTTMSSCFQRPADRPWIRLVYVQVVSHHVV